MPYYKIKNWEEYQHYKDRNPPWIKLHNSLLDDYDYLCLQDASKLLLIHLWMLASRTNNKIPTDINYIRSKTCLIDTKHIDASIRELIDKGFLTGDSEALAQCKQVARPEERRGEERQRREREESLFDFFWEAFPRQRRGNKQKAEAAYKKALTENRATEQEILDGVQRYARSDEVSRGYAKGAAAWLNDDRWQSDYTAVHKKQRSSYIDSVLDA